MGSPSSARSSSYRKPSVVTWLAYVGMTVLAVWIPVRDGLDVAPVVLTTLAALLVGAAVGWFDRRLGLAMFLLIIGGIIVVVAMGFPKAYQLSWGLGALVGLGLGRDLRHLTRHFGA